MATRRRNEEKVPGTKAFVPDEIIRGIEKVRHRIEEVRGLDPRTPHGDALIENVELRIRETIRDVFGDNSPEFHRYQFLEVQDEAILGYPPLSIMKMLSSTGRLASKRAFPEP